MLLARAHTHTHMHTEHAGCQQVLTISRVSQVPLLSYTHPPTHIHTCIHTHTHTHTGLASRRFIPFPEYRPQSRQAHRVPNHGRCRWKCATHPIRLRISSARLFSLCFFCFFCFFVFLYFFLVFFGREREGAFSGFVMDGVVLASRIKCDAHVIFVSDRRDPQRTERFI